jgi:hypothetical protein
MNHHLSNGDIPRRRRPPSGAAVHTRRPEASAGTHQTWSQNGLSQNGCGSHDSVQSCPRLTRWGGGDRQGCHGPSQPHRRKKHMGSVPRNRIYGGGPRKGGTQEEGNQEGETMPQKGASFRSIVYIDSHVFIDMLIIITIIIIIVKIIIIIRVTRESATP